MWLVPRQGAAWFKEQEGGPSGLSDADPWAMVPCMGRRQQGPHCVLSLYVYPEPGLERQPFVLTTPWFVEQKRASVSQAGWQLTTHSGSHYLVYGALGSNRGRGAGNSDWT